MLSSLRPTRTRTRMILLCASLTLIGCATPPQHSNPIPTPPSKPTATQSTTPPPKTIATPMLSTSGYGAIRFGGQLNQLPQDIRASLKHPIDPAEFECTFVEFKRYPNVIFMVESGIITRADLLKNQPNSLDATFNMSSAKLRSRYPNMQVSQHEYEEKGHYLTLPTANKKSAFVLEEVKGRITAIRAGLQPSVSYVEGCA